VEEIIKYIIVEKTQQNLYKWGL